MRRFVFFSNCIFRVGTCITHVHCFSRVLKAVSKLKKKRKKPSKLEDASPKKSATGKKQRQKKRKKEVKKTGGSLSFGSDEMTGGKEWDVVKKRADEGTKQSSANEVGLLNSACLLGDFAMQC